MKPKFHYEPSVAVRRRMERAARMRATGQSWAAVANKLRCAISTCMHWPCRFAVVWAHMYSAALAERDEDAESESVRTLREMLRNSDLKVQREAARDLIRLMRRRDRRIRDATARAAHPLEGFHNEQLEALLRAIRLEEEIPDSADR